MIEGQEKCVCGGRFWQNSSFGHIKIYCDKCGASITSAMRSGDMNKIWNEEMKERWSNFDKRNRT